MSNTAISVRSLTKTYKLYNQPIDRLKEALHPLKKSYHKNFNALDGVSFEINRGETVGIIGRNGSGKSTLLKLITGVLTPTSGRAIVHGRVSAILELGAGFNGEMTGLENIYLNNTINGIPESETAKRVAQIVDFAELGEFIHQPLKTYSSGMKARLAFAVAINVEPDILIVDEALSVGDAAFQRKCFAKMEQIRQAGATILFVSHSEASIVSLCNRAIWLVNGSKVLDGEPKLVTNLYLKHINNKKLSVKELLDEYEALLISPKPKVKDKTENAITNNVDFGKEFFSADLESKSKIIHRSDGAEILGIHIQNESQKKVNVIHQNNLYRIYFSFKLLRNMHDVRIGLAIKDIKGNIITGAAFEFVKHSGVNVNQTGIHEGFWEFDCLLVEGVFVIDAVVIEHAATERKVVSKVNDAYLFKVMPNKNEQIITSHVALIKGFEVI
ncbi:ABC transporter ATP-binding protein [Thiomicrospira sp.]|uniref:ABC transporter ATP-binding protein n=1 Tax=Thiomicrospira sp. TaxID=935 RepID=UPI002F932029